MKKEEFTYYSAPVAKTVKISPQAIICLSGEAEAAKNSTEMTEGEDNW